MARPLWWHRWILLVLAVVFARSALAQTTVNVRLEPTGGSAVSGTATLNPEGPGTRVTMQVTGIPAGSSVRATMFAGTCIASGASSAELPSLVAGEDGTANASGPILFRGTEPVAMPTIVDGAHSLAIVDAVGVVACGLIPLPEASPTVGALPAPVAESSWWTAAWPIGVVVLVSTSVLFLWWTRGRRSSALN